MYYIMKCKKNKEKMYKSGFQIKFCISNTAALISASLYYKEVANAANNYPQN